MFSRIWLINLILILGALFFGLKAYGVWTRDVASPLQTPPRETRKGPAGKGGLKKGLPKKRLLPESAFSVVVEKNLFAPERKEVKPEAAKPKAKAPQPPKKSPLEEKKIEASLKAITVYGVVVSDDYRGALVTDVKKPPPPEKKKSIRRRPRVKRGPAKQPAPKGRGVRWVQVGDELGEFKVAGIMKDRIVLKRGEKSYERPVYDKDKPKARRALVARAGPTVISTSSTAGRGIKKAPPKKRIAPARTVRKPASSRKRSKEEIRRAALERLRQVGARKK
ncbi:MAG: hypothetical protein JRJ09_17890 [Deltaproteobacteria bacterium]|nr:hypothetical protein [Deltaproteobacteria bacterium]